MLTLDVELLTGAYRATLPDGGGAEWPPHPDRVFSALVQAWGDGDRDAAERVALEWLERLPAPEIEASSFASERTAPTVYVPPNDPKGTAMEAMPDRRRRQARTFHVVVPEHPMVRLRWSAAPPPSEERALHALASRVASLGHSASLVRFSFRDQHEPFDLSSLWQPAADGNTPLRTTYPGRLDDLERWFAHGGPRSERPRSRNTSAYRPPDRNPRVDPAAESTFAGPQGWFVFEDEGVGGFRPDLLAFAHVARTVRNALMSLAPNPPPEVVSGHAADGGPSSRPHAAVVPLANVGWEHANGELLGFAVVLPRGASPDERRALLEPLARFVRFDGDRATATLRLLGEASWRLERSGSPSRASLRPERWCGTSRVWASATPVMLDRFPDRDDPLEEARLVADSCRHIGLPQPVEIELHKHSSVTGSPSAYPSRGRRHGDWTIPVGSKLAGRLRRHVVLRFEDAVRGPILLGAGRYQGFGLMLPIEETS